MGTHTGPVCDPVRMVSANIPLLILVLWTSQAHQKPLIDDLVKGLGGRIDDILCQYTCRKFSVKACQDTKEKRCTMVYNKECHTSSVLHCHDEHRDECHTVYREQCQTQYKEKCVTSYEEVCTPSYGYKPPKCEKKPQEKCHHEPENVSNSFYQILSRRINLTKMEMRKWMIKSKLTIFMCF